MSRKWKNNYRVLEYREVGFVECEWGSLRLYGSLFFKKKKEKEIGGIMNF